MSELRSIPAWAGKPRGLRMTCEAHRVYPRVGGETLSEHQDTSSFLGLSPRGRGNPSSHQGRPCDMRSIPAWAGKPHDPRLETGTPAVYPRVGGETIDSRLITMEAKGLSPRGRGNPRR